MCLEEERDMSVKTRDANIELLRVIMACGVVVLHYNGSVAFSHVAQGSANYFILLLLEGLFICAVNLFMLISGYYLSVTKQRRAVKVLDLLIQVMVIGVMKYLLNSLLSGESIRVKSLFFSAIPNSYFVTLYLAVYLFSPYINLALEHLSQKQFRLLLGLSLILFSVWPTMLDIVKAVGYDVAGMYTTNTAGSQSGYSFLNFALMYLIGAYLRRFGSTQMQQTGRLVIGLIGCAALIFIWQLFLPETARSYCNPLVIWEAVLFFRLFQKVKTESKVVKTLAKATFTCYLFHDVLLHYIGIQLVVNGNPLILLGHMLLSVIGIFLASWCVWKLYDLLSHPLIRWMDDRISFLDRFLSVHLVNDTSSGGCQ